MPGYKLLQLGRGDEAKKLYAKGVIMLANKYGISLTATLPIETISWDNGFSSLVCQNPYLLTDWTEHEKHASRVRQNIGVHFWDVSFLFDMFWVIEEDETRLLLRYHDDL